MGKRAQWHKTLDELGQEQGFYRPLSKDHNALFLRGDRTLVVTFDNLDDARQDVQDRMPWGSQFISSRGWSSLGIGAHGWTWYRDEAVLDFFDELRDTKFFDQFEKVVFYGTSMAGYAATAFSSAAPGATVIAMNPQATLDRSITSGWEHRFRRSWSRDFSGRFAYGPAEAKSAAQVYLFFDPKVTQDAMHAALFQDSHTLKIKCRHFGHGLTTMLSQIGVLKELVEKCVDGSASKTDIYRLLRARKHNPKYQKSILNALKAMERPRLIHIYSQAVLRASAGKNRPHFKHAMREAEQVLGIDSDHRGEQSVERQVN